MPGDKLAGGVKARGRRNLKLSLRGRVEKQPQHRPARLNKPRPDRMKTDRLGPDWLKKPGSRIHGERTGC